MKKPTKPSLPAGSGVLKIFSFLAVAVLCVLFFLLVRQLGNMRRSAEAVNHTNQVRNALWLTLTKLKAAEARQHGFLLTQDSTFLRGAANQRNEMQAHLSALRKQVSDEPDQLRRVDTLQGLAFQRLQLIDTVWGLYYQQPNNQTAVKAALSRGKRLTGTVEGRLRLMDSAAVQMLDQHTADSNQYLITTPRLGGFLVLAALLVLLFAFWRQRQLLSLSRNYLQKNLDAAEALRKNALLLEYAEQINNAGSLEWNYSQNKAVFSANLHRLLHYDAKEDALSMDDFLSRMDEKDRTRFSETIAFGLQNGQTGFAVRFWAMDKGGERRHFQCNGRVEMNEAGTAVVTATVNDVTEEELLKQQLQERKDLIESIVENGSDLVAVIDTAGRYTVWNKANEQQFGLSKTEVIGRRIEEVFPFIKNDERRRYIEEGLRGKAAYLKELPYFNGLKTAEFSYIPLNGDGGDVIGLLIMAHDITERKRAAEELQKANAELKEKNAELEKANAFNRLVTDLAPNNIVVMDAAKGRPLFLNRQAGEMFGAEPGPLSETQDNVLEQIIHPDDYPAETEKIAQLQKAGDADILESECRLRNKDGQYRLMHLWRAAFKRNAAGGLEQYISISLDVTDIRKAERELKEKNRELLAANEEVSAFNYVASHDLQEPMRKVQIFANVLEETEGSLTPQGRSYLQKIQSAAGRLRRLISDLLSFSQINMLDGATQAVDLNDVLAEATFALKGQMDEKGGRLVVAALPSVNGVAFQLQQLFENLISNSIKYSRPEAPPVITVTAQTVQGKRVPFAGADEGQPYHCLRFSDNGIGFKPEYAAKIFEMFERLHHMTEYSGTGLGLAICRKVVQNHKGFIRANGTPNEGAVIEVYLPA